MNITHLFVNVDIQFDKIELYLCNSLFDKKGIQF